MFNKKNKVLFQTFSIRFEKYVTKSMHLILAIEFQLKREDIKKETKLKYIVAAVNDRGTVSLYNSHSPLH